MGLLVQLISVGLDPIFVAIGLITVKICCKPPYFDVYLLCLCWAQ